MKSNKKKIFNDPIYGFISIPYEILIDLIDHPYFQRLNRIKQLGLSHLVYPGAHHTRFHHAMGAMHLMQQAIENIRVKGHEITDHEAKSVLITILLHDIGHGPFSHTLEHTIVNGISHEDISILFMNELNRQYNGELTTAIEIFENKYSKKFLHQLVSSQLDMDRLDYLKRDSFYTGVSEGVVSSNRIIKMLNVVNDQLVVEEKGIYSIEKFLIARRLMYWQVYLHKTVVAAENLLVKILLRVKELAKKEIDVFATPALKFFLYNKISKDDFSNRDVLKLFSQLDDYDIFSAIKVWISHEDKVLSELCRRLINRELPKIVLQKTPFDVDYIEQIRSKTALLLNVSKQEAEYFVFNNYIVNNAYNVDKDHINMLLKTGKVLDISEASDNLNIQALSSPVKKYFICFPKEII